MCVCPGDVLIFECKIVGPGATVWTGTGFKDCPSQDNQILFLHNLFMTGSVSECNDGSILAKGIEVIDTVNGRCYRSQLNITVSPFINNTSVTCINAIGDTQTVIDNSTIRISGTQYTQGLQ